MMKGEGFRCENHPDQEAIGYCCKCAAFLCEECAVTAQDPLIYCPPCYEKHVGAIPMAAPANPVSSEAESTVSARQSGSVKSTAFRVEIHWADGSTKQGVTYSIRPDKRGFFIAPFPSTHTEKDEVQEFVAFNKVKAVFILKNPLETKRESSEAEFIPEGHEITVEFKDGDILEGYALGEYDPMLPRFHVIPKDDRNSTYVSVLVERDSTEHIQLGEVFRAKELRQLIQGPVRKLLLCCYIDNLGAVADVESIATAIGRTARIVDREIAIFLSEGLMKEVEGPPNRKLKFLPPSDIQTINFITEHDQELHEFYTRQKRLGM